MSGSQSQTISVQGLSQLCNISERRCQQLANEGVMARTSARGDYKLIESVNGYIKYLQQSGSEDAVDKNELAADLKKWQIEKTRFESRRLELELLKEQNQTILVEKGQAAVAECFNAIKRSNKKWLARMHAAIPGLPISIIEKNQQELVELFNSFAELDIRD